MMKIEGTAKHMFRAAKSIVDARHLPELNDRAWTAAESIVSQFYEQRGAAMQPMDKCHTSITVDDALGELLTSALVAQKLKDNS